MFIEANVKKWGLAPMTGSLAPPPPYGSEAGSILLEYGAVGVREGQGFLGHLRSGSAQMRLGRGPTSPGPQRSPTDISLAQLSITSSRDEDAGEGNSGVNTALLQQQYGQYQENVASHGGKQPTRPQTPAQSTQDQGLAIHASDDSPPPPDYESPPEDGDHERTPRLTPSDHLLDSPPIPTYEAAISLHDNDSRERLLDSDDDEER